MSSHDVLNFIRDSVLSVAAAEGGDYQKEFFYDDGGDQAIEILISSSEDTPSDLSRNFSIVIKSSPAIVYQLNRVSDVRNFISTFKLPKSSKVDNYIVQKSVSRLDLFNKYDVGSSAPDLCNVVLQIDDNAKLTMFLKEYTENTYDIGGSIITGKNNGFKMKRPLTYSPLSYSNPYFHQLFEKKSGDYAPGYNDQSLTEELSITGYLHEKEAILEFLKNQMKYIFQLRYDLLQRQIAALDGPPEVVTSASNTSKNKSSIPKGFTL